MHERFLKKPEARSLDLFGPKHTVIPPVAEAFQFVDDKKADYTASEHFSQKVTFDGFRVRAIASRYGHVLPKWDQKTVLDIFRSGACWIDVRPGSPRAIPVFYRVSENFRSGWLQSLIPTCERCD